MTTHAPTTIGQTEGQLARDTYAKEHYECLYASERQRADYLQTISDANKAYAEQQRRLAAMYRKDAWWWCVGFWVVFVVALLLAFN
jgi:hypothetical protein